MQGKKILNLTSLRITYLNKKAVVVPDHPSWTRPKPASVVIGLPGIMLLDLFNKGMYEYEK